MSTSSTNWKKVWILVFCVITVIASLFYVPHKVSYGGKFTGDTKYLSFFQTEVDSNYKFKLQVDYSAMIFREVVIAVACVGGYVFSTLKK